MNRQEELICILLKADKPLTTTDLAKNLDVSSRTIRADLEKIESHILAHDLHLKKKPHAGIWIEGTKENKDSLFLSVTGGNNIVEIYSKEYRKACILVYILLGNNRVYVDKIADMLYVSRSTIEKDLIDVSNWLKEHNLKLIRKTNYGLYVEGNEEDIRNAACILASNLNERNLSIESFLETYLDVDVKKIEDIVRSWNDEYEMHLSEVNSNNLAFHASIMLTRIARNKSLELAKSNNFNNNAFSFKKQFNALINKLSKLAHVKIPEEESNYLLMHLYGMYLDKESFLENEFLSDLRNLANNITDDFIENSDKIVALDLKNNEQFRESLILHLLPTVYRLKYGLNLYNPLLSEIKTNYAGSYSLASIVNSSFEKYLNVTASEEEIAYIALHLSIVVERTKEVFKVAVVCAMRIGVSKLLTLKLEENFPNAIFVHCAMDDTDVINECKYIVSTIKLNIDRPYVLINPILKDIDIQKIRTLIYGNTSITKNNFSLQTIMIIHNKTNRMNVLREMSNCLRLCGYVTPLFLESVIKREEMGSTEVGNGIVLTHGFHETVKRSQIAFCKLDNPIKWNTQKVNFIVMLAVAKEDAKNVMHMNWLYQMLNNNKTIDEITKCNKEEEIYEILINATKKN